MKSSFPFHEVLRAISRTDGMYKVRFLRKSRHQVSFSFCRLWLLLLLLILFLLLFGAWYKSIVARTRTKVRPCTGTRAWQQGGFFLLYVWWWGCWIVPPCCCSCCCWSCCCCCSCCCCSCWCCCCSCCCWCCCCSCCCCCCCSSGSEMSNWRWIWSMVRLLPPLPNPPLVLPNPPVDWPDPPGDWPIRPPGDGDCCNRSLVGDNDCNVVGGDNI